jgi:hypothetical protein
VAVYLYAAQPGWAAPITLGRYLNKLPEMSSLTSCGRVAEYPVTTNVVFCFGFVFVSVCLLCSAVNERSSIMNLDAKITLNGGEFLFIDGRISYVQYMLLCLVMNAIKIEVFFLRSPQNHIWRGLFMFF